MAPWLHDAGGPATTGRKGIHFMNWDQVEGKWKQMKGSVREKWGKLTDDDLDRIAGKREKLVGRLQECYGLRKEEAEKQCDEWCKTAEDIANSEGQRETLELRK